MLRQIWCELSWRGGDCGRGLAVTKALSHQQEALVGCQLVVKESVWPVLNVSESSSNHVSSLRKRASQFQTLSSFLDGHVKYIPWFCETLHLKNVQGCVAKAIVSPQRCTQGDEITTRSVSAIGEVFKTKPRFFCLCSSVQKEMTHSCRELAL